ncbi:hypothetical protein BHE74_00058750 [Ensete ventricosum]|nr:hypothetical protein GW17_00031748 [Ensete ventricosum]RWW36258.1 hypothetical protein BHE74_00058750 [Ensete ventricosum]RZR92116.1 hypothetical protein BHM03_00020368 [Ensete ventricosum]
MQAGDDIPPGDRLDAIIVEKVLPQRELPQLREEADPGVQLGEPVGGEIQLDEVVRDLDLAQVVELKAREVEAASLQLRFLLQFFLSRRRPLSSPSDPRCFIGVSTKALLHRRWRGDRRGLPKKPTKTLKT